MSKKSRVALQEELMQIFQHRESELDFGIYRMLNYKSREVESFFKRVAFSKESLEMLLPFFSLYYTQGELLDFGGCERQLSKSKSTQDVTLSWANRHQYFVKSSANLSNYQFRVGERRIHFKLVEAEGHSDNNKSILGEEKRFILSSTKQPESIDGELYIYFEYKSVGKIRQDRLNKESLVELEKAIADREFLTLLMSKSTNKSKKTLLEEHLKRYTSKSGFDYFIHKDLGGFLKGELEFYIKDRLLNLDELFTLALDSERLREIEYFRRDALKIIELLAKLEEFQKLLWEEKKLIRESHYSMTLDRVDERFYGEILSSKEQLEEWKRLYGLKIESREDLKAHPYISLDTKFFTRVFKYKLLEQFENLERESSGLLINAENFAGLKLLQRGYRGEISTIYIDPPYNTGNDEFVYSDRYRDSSWMSFIYDRVRLSKELLSDEGVIFTSIDDAEQSNLKFLKELIFGKENFVATMIRENKAGSGHDSKSLAVEYDYIELFAKELAKVKFNRKVVDVESDKKYRYSDEYVEMRGKYYLRDLDYKGSYSEMSDYPITLPSGKIIYSGGAFGRPNTWRWGREKFEWGLESGYIVLDDKKEKVYIKQYQYVDNKGEPYQRTVPYRALTKFMNGKGSKELDDMFGQKSFSFPKSTEMMEYIININSTKESTILDFFGGSGTTVNAVINLNRADKGERKYILIEMGDYFDTVTKPRVQKALYSSEWKGGVAENREGLSQMFKYFRLESYEERLNRVDFESPLDETFLEGELRSLEPLFDLPETFNYFLGFKVEKVALREEYLLQEGYSVGEERKTLIVWLQGSRGITLESLLSEIDWSRFDRDFKILYISQELRDEAMERLEGVEIREIESTFQLELQEVDNEVL